MILYHHAMPTNKLTNKKLEQEVVAIRPLNLDLASAFSENEVTLTSPDNGKSQRWHLFYSKMSESEKNDLFAKHGYILRGRPDLAKKVSSHVVGLVGQVIDGSIKECGHMAVGMKSEISAIRDAIAKEFPFVTSVTFIFIPHTGIGISCEFHGTLLVDPTSGDGKIRDEIEKFIKADRKLAKIGMQLLSPIIVKDRIGLEAMDNSFNMAFRQSSNEDQRLNYDNCGSLVMATGHFWRGNPEEGIDARLGGVTANSAPGWKVLVCTKTPKQNNNINGAFLLAYNCAQLLSAVHVTVSPNPKFIYEYKRSEALAISQPANLVWNNADKSSSINYCKTTFKKLTDGSVQANVDSFFPESGKADSKVIISQLNAFESAYSEGSREALYQWKSCDLYWNETLTMALIRFHKHKEQVAKQALVKPTGK